MNDDDWITICFKRENRNQLLSSSDRYILSDYPITSNNLILIKDYRQQLRDYMNLDEVKIFNSSNNIPLPEFPPFRFPN